MVWKWWRDDLQTSNVPIIVLSAKGYGILIRSSAWNRCDDHVTKLFSCESLVASFWVYVVGILSFSFFFSFFENEADTEIVIGDLHILPDAFFVSRQQRIDFWPIANLNLLYHLATHVGQGWPVSTLFETVGLAGITLVIPDSGRDGSSSLRENEDNTRTSRIYSTRSWCWILYEKQWLIN